MGLKMSEKKALTYQVCARYRGAKRKDKTKILDEFVKTTGYNRKYALRILNLYGKTRLTTFDGQTVNLKAAKPRRPRNRAGKTVYGQEVINCLRHIWEFFWYKCGKYLAQLIRENIRFLEESRDPDFHITAEVRQKLLEISPSTIDRRLKPERDKPGGRGISGTRLGDAALLKQIPVRTHYGDAETHTPGYFQTDTVHHCGDRDCGEFNLTLTATDVASGWTELRALRNKAHKWTLEELQDIHETLPFRMIELHSDNGKEFVNHDTINWQKVLKELNLSRSRPRHKNDNCFAEQKNNAFVRNYVGHSRYDSDKELAALERVYDSLCPLINFFIPNKKLITKTSVGSKTIKKYGDVKTPYQRLLESPHLDETEKVGLTDLYKLYNPVVLQQNVHRAANALLSAHRAKLHFHNEAPMPESYILK